MLKEAADAELVEAVRAVGARGYVPESAAGRATGGRGRGTADGGASRWARRSRATGSTRRGPRRDGRRLPRDRPDARTPGRAQADRPSHARDPVFRARFERECRLAAAIDHPHVVPVLHAGAERGRLYVTMRFVDGTDLRALLRDEGRLSAGRAVALSARSPTGLDEAHAHGLVHRDVKPANMLIGRRGGAEHAYLTDFGVSWNATAART